MNWYQARQNRSDWKKPGSFFIKQGIENSKGDNFIEALYTDLMHVVF